MQFSFYLFLAAAAMLQEPAPAEQEGWYNPFPGAAKRAAEKKVNEAKFEANHENLHSFAKEIRAAKNDLKVPHHHAAHKKEEEKPAATKFLAPKEQVNDYPKAKVVHHHTPKHEKKVALVSEAPKVTEGVKVVSEDVKVVEKAPEVSEVRVLAEHQHEVAAERKAVRVGKKHLGTHSNHNKHGAAKGRKHAAGSMHRHSLVSQPGKGDRVESVERVSQPGKGDRTEDEETHSLVERVAQPGKGDRAEAVERVAQPGKGDRADSTPTKRALFEAVEAVEAERVGQPGKGDRAEVVERSSQPGKGDRAEDKETHSLVERVAQPGKGDRKPVAKKSKHSLLKHHHSIKKTKKAHAHHQEESMQEKMRHLPGKGGKDHAKMSAPVKEEKHALVSSEEEAQHKETKVEKKAVKVEKKAEEKVEKKMRDLTMHHEKKAVKVAEKHEDLEEDLKHLPGKGSEQRHEFVPLHHRSLISKAQTKVHEHGPHTRK